MFILINSIIDFFFILDILVSFRTTYIDDKGQEVFEPYRIARKYMKIIFWIDLATVIPFDIFAPKPDSQSNLH